MTLILCYENPDKNAEGRQVGVPHKESRQNSTDTGWRGFGMWITYLCKRLCIMDLCVYLNS